jgi:quinolinate synthase
MTLAFDVPITPKDNPVDTKLRDEQVARIEKLLKKHNAVVVAHYYTAPEVQYLAEATGGFIGDSLAMAQYGLESKAQTLVVAGVRFMGESAKILSPHKRVFMPTVEATCSLDLGCPADKFAEFKAKNPDRTVVVYVNTSAAVKALADWTVTSSCALDIVRHLDDNGEKILWAPDRYLGDYIQKQTGADVLMWDGSCVVHEEFKAEGIVSLKAQYPDAAVLVHPESPASVIALADVVGSTSKLLGAVSSLEHDTFIVATDRGIFYKMMQNQPNKTFIEAPTAGEGATCRSCAHCPWMAMNQLDNLESSLNELQNEIYLGVNVIEAARLPLMRMLEFSK